MAGARRVDPSPAVGLSWLGLETRAEGNAVAGPVVTVEAGEFTVRNSAVLAERAGVVGITIPIPASETFGVSVELYPRSVLKQSTHSRRVRRQ